MNNYTRCPRTTIAGGKSRLPEKTGHIFVVTFPSEFSKSIPPYKVRSHFSGLCYGLTCATRFRPGAAGYVMCT